MNGNTKKEDFKYHNKFNSNEKFRVGFLDDKTLWSFTTK